MSTAEMGRAAIAAYELFCCLTLEFQAETSLVPHGKVLSSLDYTLTLPDLPNIPNLKCPLAGGHSKGRATSEISTEINMSLSTLIVLKVLFGCIPKYAG